MTVLLDTNCQQIKFVSGERSLLQDADVALAGIQQFITNGAIADLYTILAKTPNGPSFFAVEKGTPGLSPGRT